MLYSIVRLCKEWISDQIVCSEKGNTCLYPKPTHLENSSFLNSGFRLGHDPYSIAEQRSITDGRIVPVGKGFVRKPPKRVDYLLRYERNSPLAVVEAKAAWKTAGDGMQQAKDYAEILGLKFAYATNGREMIEFDYFTGKETLIPTYPRPADLWVRYRTGKGLADDTVATQLTPPMNHTVGKGERYYQEIAIRATAGRFRIS